MIKDKGESRARPQIKGKSTDRRHRNVEVTKLEIVKAARDLFSHESYDHVTIRDIAAKSGCNSSLIARYFGSKEGLFREAIVESIQFQEGSNFANASQLVDYLLNWVTGRSDQDWFDPSKAVFRSASVPAARDMLRPAIEENFIGPVGNLIRPNNSKLRAEVLSAVFYGLNAYRNVIGVTGLSCATAQDLAGVLQPMLIELITPQKSQEPE